MEETIKFNTKIAKEFIEKISFSGRYTLYIFSKSLENKIAFDRQNLPKKFQILDDYFYGFLVACYGMQILDFNFKEKIITPLSMNDFINEEIIKYFSDLQDNERKKAIDEYFS
ncbi:hypothetical protein MQX03_19695 [Chryseobacterium aahli]|uniref:hypothetical protein n=1 Tax=Chryseobacterium aahli TaxID=1278643 RepID=UPI001F60CC78|nr:hypothetical protein [Chryseobacterium aahli]MCI3939402.1 hypothetical protein [Chryseobacterium aahli]